jgi:predicted kinase
MGERDFKNISILQFVILSGLPASGKSTWAKTWVELEPKQRIRVNRDDIRRQLGPYWIPSREKLVTAIEENMIIISLSKGYNVISDNTNLRGIDRFKMLVFNAQNSGLINHEVHFELKSFLDVDVEECIKRDALRTDTERVGESVIRRMYNSIQH